MTDPGDPPDAACGELPHATLVARRKKAVAGAGWPKLCRTRKIGLVEEAMAPTFSLKRAVLASDTVERIAVAPSVNP
jgi:hypothetical protein